MSIRSFYFPVFCIILFRSQDKEEHFLFSGASGTKNKKVDWDGLKKKDPSIAI
jgi:hypothetical protein